MREGRERGGNLFSDASPCESRKRKKKREVIYKRGNDCCVRTIKFVCLFFLLKKRENASLTFDLSSSIGDI